MPMTVRYTVIDGEVIAETRNGVRSLYVPDPLGSTVALIDNTATVTDTFSYWPYGELQSHAGSPGSNPTPLQYVGTAGYYTDSASKTYVRARVLDTPKARWLTQDPIGFEGGDRNLYRYVWNNPIRLKDPSGLDQAGSSPVVNYDYFDTDRYKKTTCSRCYDKNGNFRIPTNWQIPVYHQIPDEIGTVCHISSKSHRDCHHCVDYWCWCSRCCKQRDLDDDNACQLDCTNYANQWCDNPLGPTEQRCYPKDPWKHHPPHDKSTHQR